MNILILCIGKPRTEWYEDAITDYMKRIVRPFSITISTITGANIDDAEKSKRNEARDILAKIKPEDYVVLLEENGKIYDTPAFSQMLERLRGQGLPRIVFVIGGAYGIGAELRQRAQACLSLSPLTFPHEMARLILVEQLYRGINMMQGGKYHH